jgi:hypothetical protein
MGKPISSVGAATSPITTQISGSEPTQSVDQSPAQSPTQSPTQSAPAPKPEPKITIWPPAYGYRRSATEGNREAHNGWQEQWLAVGPKVTKGAIDAVAALKPIVEPLLQHGSHGRWA